MLHWCLYYSFQDCLSLCLTCRTFPLFPIDCRCCSYIDYNQRKIRLIPSLFSLKFGTTLFLEAGTSFWDMFTTWNVSIRLQLIILAEHMNIDSDQTNRYSFIFFFICSATHREYSCNELLDQKSFLLSSGCTLLGISLVRWSLWLAAAHGPCMVQLQYVGLCFSASRTVGISRTVASLGDSILDHLLD